MYNRLQELNIPSVIIRNTDETLPKNERIERVLNAYNNAPNTILISNHINAGGRVSKIVMDEIYWCITS